MKLETLELNILLDEPSKVWSPGDIVSGEVVTACYDDRLTVKGLQLIFFGRCYKGGKYERNGWRVVTRNVCSYFYIKKILVGNETTPMKFPFGSNHYQFSFAFPPINLPASYTTDYGGVGYALIAEVIEPSFGRPVCVAGKTLRFRAPVPLQHLDLRPLEVKMKMWKRFFSILNCFDGPVYVTVKAPQTGYYPGQVMDLLVEVNNMSELRVQDVSLELVQEDTYNLHSGGKKLVNKRKIHFQHRFGKTVNAYDGETWRIDVRIPESLPPTNLGGCEFIKVNFALEIEALISPFKKKLMSRVPITVGCVAGKMSVGELPPTYDAQCAPSPPAYNTL